MPNELPAASRRLAARPLPNEDVTERSPIDLREPGFVADLRRCIGCHACSVACKTAHAIPLGEFPLRVRWLPRPDQETYAFVPVFSESLCGGDPESTENGLEPACVRACPTDALRLVDLASAVNAANAATADSQTNPSNAPTLRTLEGPDLDDAKHAVRYIGLEDFVAEQIHRGAALDPRDPDPIYEQK